MWDQNVFQEGYLQVKVGEWIWGWKEEKDFEIWHFEKSLFETSLVGDHAKKKELLESCKAIL